MKLLLVDGSNIVMRCAFGGDIGPAQAVRTATGMIKRVARIAAASHLVVALDCPQAPSWRKEVYPQYKAHRSVDTTPWLAEANAQWVREGWWVEAVNGHEADDVIATIGPRARARGAVAVVSGDSDVWPLVAEGIEILKPINGGGFEAVTAEAVCKKYGVARPGQLVDLKALAGESGDNIPGAAGIGPVRAQRLLEAYEDLDGVIAAGKRQACKYSALVAGQEAVVRLALRLVTLSRDVPIVPIQPRACALPAEAPAQGGRP